MSRQRIPPVVLSRATRTPDGRAAHIPALKGLRAPDLFAKQARRSVLKVQVLGVVEDFLDNFAILPGAHSNLSIVAHTPITVRIVHAPV